MDLDLINTISIIIILTVVVINIVYSVYRMNAYDEDLHYTKQRLGDAIGDLQATKKILQNYVENKVVSLVDLAEFTDMDPLIKNAYKKYIVNKVMPEVMNKIDEEPVVAALSDDTKLDKIMTGITKDIQSLIKFFTMNPNNIVSSEFITYGENMNIHDESYYYNQPIRTLSEDFKLPPPPLI